MLILISKPVYSGNNIIFADTKGSSNYLQTHVWDGNFTALNGEKFPDLAFYKQYKDKIDNKKLFFKKVW